MDEKDILKVLVEHRGSATVFCRACPHRIPRKDLIRSWGSEGMVRHQAAVIAGSPDDYMRLPGEQRLNAVRALDSETREE